MWSNSELGAAIFLSIMLGMVFMALILITTGTTYKQGQIDALTGKVQFELVTEPDSTRVWKEIRR